MVYYTFKAARFGWLVAEDLFFRKKSNEEDFPDET
jgi:hypothetical protein